jgi:malonyl-CoA decarboxylase
MNNLFLSDLMQSIAERGRAVLARVWTPAAIDAPDLATLSETLLSSKGEASGVALARDLLDRYAALDAGERARFLDILAVRFGADPQVVARAIDAYREAPDEARLMALHRATRSRRVELIQRLNAAPGATLELVRMREDVFAWMKSNPALAAVDGDFAQLFTSWFNRGFLVLRPIDWSTPANILEKIIRYEAVHTIHSWDDLRRRLAPPDRRCFAFFHPLMVDEPLIFVEVALTGEIPDAIADLLAESRTVAEPTDATTAVFYSISNCQPGLRGISFGNFLIKQVVEELHRQLPRVNQFVTLSPVPGFADWLAREQADDSSRLLTPQTRDALAALERPDWHAEPETAGMLRGTLLPLAAAYFLAARARDGRVADPVARFHLGNGARLERLNWLGDPSAKGLSQAHGLMVNYLYDLDDIEANHEAFSDRGEVAASAAVRDLLPGIVAGDRSVIPWPQTLVGKLRERGRQAPGG